MKSRAGHSLVFNLFLARGGEWGWGVRVGGWDAGYTRVIIWADHGWEAALQCANTFNSPTLLSHSGPYNEPSKSPADVHCVKRKERRKKVKEARRHKGWENTGRGEEDLQQKMRHSQKTKGALQPFRNDCVKSITVCITARMLLFWSWVSDELYPLASVYHGLLLQISHKAHKDFNLMSHRIFTFDIWITIIYSTVEMMDWLSNGRRTATSSVCAKN